MLIYLVLSYKKCSIGIYSEGLILGVKIKLRNAWVYIREGLKFGGFGHILILRFRLETT